MWEREFYTSLWNKEAWQVSGHKESAKVADESTSPCRPTISWRCRPHSSQVHGTTNINKNKKVWEVLPQVFWLVQVPCLYRLLLDLGRLYATTHPRSRPTCRFTPCKICSCPMFTPSAASYTSSTQRGWSRCFTNFLVTRSANSRRCMRSHVGLFPSETTWRTPGGMGTGGKIEWRGRKLKKKSLKEG